MRRHTPLSLRLSSAALVFCGYLALATAGHYGSPIVIVPLILVPLSPLGEWLHRRYPFYARLTTGFTVVFLIALLLSHVFFLRLLDAVTALIVYIQIHTLMHQKRVRNYHYLFLMAFFLLLVACVLSPEAEIGAVMFLFLISVTWALVALQVYAEVERSPQRAAPDIVGLKTNRVHAISEARGLMDFGLALATMLAGVGVTLLTVAFFVVTPRFEAGLFGRETPGQFRTGLSQSVDLTASGRVLPDPTPIMRVEFPDEPDGRYDGPLFWRCSTLDSYDDGIWVRYSPGGRIRGPRRRNVGSHQVTRDPLGDRRLVHQAIYMDDVPSEGVPSLPLVQTLECAGNPKGITLSWDGMGDFTVVMARRDSRRLQYEAWSEVDTFSGDRLRTAPANYEDVLGPRGTYRLTHETLEDRTRRLAGEITGGAATVYDKVVAVERWLQHEGGFSYTLDLPRLDPEHPIDDFVHLTKQGHCELFASAMALMLRSLGIPTRVVMGYRGGEWSDADRSYLVRASMAHLWVEVYFIDHGWVTFDPSPPSTDAGGYGIRRFTTALSHYILKAKMRWYSDVIAYDRGLQVRTLRDLASRFTGFGSGLLAWGDRAPETGRFLPAVSVRTFAAVAALGAVLVLASRRQRRTLGRRYVLTDDQTRAVRLFKGLRRRLDRLGVECDGRTAEEIQEALVEWPMSDTRCALEILLTYNEARFGGRPLSRERYSRLRKSLQALRAT